MTDVTQKTELSVRVPKELAELARLMAVVSAAGIETLAHCMYHDRHSDVVLLVTDHPVKTSEWLRTAGFRTTTNEVVLVQTAYAPRLAALLGHRLSAAGIGVLYSYASWTEGQRAYVVFKTTDDNRAVRLLRAERAVHDAARAKTIAPDGHPVEHAAA